MNSTFKRILSVMLVLCMMSVAFASCGPKDDKGEAKLGNYTYNSYSTSLGNNWNPHTWETNADQSILDYVSSPFCTMQVLNSEDGIYQWVYEMATSITDVTKDHQDDLTKYKVSLPEGKTAAEVDAGYVYEIKLNPNAKWENGTPINADDYIYSMQQLLNPEMKNYRANLYYSGESAVAGGNAYYYSGSMAWYENIINNAYTMDDLTKGDNGQYYSAAGEPVYFAVGFALSEWLGGNTLKDYVEAYGDAYFGMDTWEDLVALVDENGLVPLTDESYALFAPVTTGNPAWGETEADLPAYMVYGVMMPEATYDVVGCYKVDDYTIRYVNEAYIDLNYFLTSCTSTWLVYKDYYEAGKDTTGTLVTTDYGTKIENTMSYGPYKIKALQADKQIVYVQNENWYGYEKDGDNLVSWTPYEVDGENIQRYMTTKIIINVMDDDAAKQAFLKGELDDWTPSADDLLVYSTSEQLYKVDETYTQSFFFNTNVDMLKEMDNSKGNTNSVVLSNTNFRKAFSLAIDRAEFVTATAGYKPAYAIMNNLYFYDVYNDPESSYRNSDEAMQAICNLYDVKYGEGTPYATLKDAYQSINGYNLTEAQSLMAKALEELTAEGLYTAGQEIHIRIGWSKAPLDSAANKQIELMNKYINNAIEGTGFGKITLEGVGSIEDRYGDVPAGNFAIGYGAWGGAAFYPFRNFQVYCDPDQYDINEAADWDPTTETLTINVNGTDETLTWQAWSGALTGTGKFTEADFKTKLAITATLEEKYLEKVYRIPLCGTTACSMLSFKCNYYTEDYNIMYGFGGLELMTYNYTDEEWTNFVTEQGGKLNYE